MPLRDTSARSPRTPTTAVGIVGLTLVTAVTVAGLLWEHPPAPRPHSADPAVFSAERAWEHLEEVAAEPSPIGSEENARVRSYLVEELESLGVEVEIQEGLGAYSFRSSSNEVGRVHNVVGRLPGADPTGRVILAAHYDTVFHSPGASDDKASVAAILETARALTSGSSLRNDLVLLLTDGEEPGLLGASLFAEEEASKGGVVLNWEGYGNTGPSQLFQTSHGNAGLVGEFARSAADPVGESAMTEFFQFGGSNTDFTALREVGFVGLDFSWVDGIAHYHTATDTLENLDSSSLQQHGDNMLSLARGFGERDLTTLDTDEDVTYFTVFGAVTAYSSQWIWPLTIAGISGVLVTAMLARRRHMVTVPRLMVGTVGMLVPLLAAPIVAIGWWQLLLSIRPEYEALTRGDTGDPFNPGFYRLALVAFSLAILIGWYLMLLRRVGHLALAVGGLVWVGVLGVGAAATLPGVSYLGAVSALAASAGIIVSLLVGGKRPVWGVMAITIGVMPGVVLNAITSRSTLSALGIAGGYAAAAGVVLTGLVALPLLGTALGEGSQDRVDAPSRSRWRRPLVPLSALALALVFTVVGLSVSRFDDDRPESAHLSYLFDPDTDGALWVSENTAPHPWAARLAPNEAEGAPMSFPLPYRSRVEWQGQAETAPLEPPELTVLDEPVDGEEHSIRLRVVSPRNAEILVLTVDAIVEEVTVSASGMIAPKLHPARPKERSEWPFELRFSDPPMDGFDVQLRLANGGVPRLAVSDITIGLDDIDEFANRPRGVGSSIGRLPSDSVVVGRMYQP
ncbi:MAG: M28 family peptidase [Acidimicrobiia bacterium]|nr:M28 family peptidase [Acidimicrobiia bacterium]